MLSLFLNQLFNDLEASFNAYSHIGKDSELSDEIMPHRLKTFKDKGKFYEYEGVKKPQEDVEITEGVKSVVIESKMTAKGYTSSSFIIVSVPELADMNTLKFEKTGENTYKITVAKKENAALKEEAPVKRIGHMAPSEENGKIIANRPVEKNDDFNNKAKEFCKKAESLKKPTKEDLEKAVFDKLKEENRMLENDNKRQLETIARLQEKIEKFEALARSISEG